MEDRLPTKPSFLFAPGAGAPSTHPWMQKWKERLETIGRVTLFDYDYMRKGRRRPDPPPQLIAAHRQALMSDVLRKMEEEGLKPEIDPEGEAEEE